MPGENELSPAVPSGYEIKKAMMRGNHAGFHILYNGRAIRNKGLPVLFATYEQARDYIVGMQKLLTK